MNASARFAISLLVTLVPFASACSDSSSGPGGSRHLSAQIRRTEYGIPHVTANDWESLAFGYGYAYSQDDYCVTMREIALASGRSAELMGESEGDPGADFLFRFLNGTKDEFRARFVDVLPPEVQALGRGFAAGMNRYLADTGLADLAQGPAGCRNAPWVYEVDDVDLWMYLRRIALAGSSDLGVIRDAILAVSGPTGAARVSTAAAADADRALADALRDTAAPGLANLARSLAEHGGSNGIALGRDLTRNGKGMLLGNPHQPWNGSGRWYEIHLTIPGVYDAAGAALQGLPWVGIGFNRDVAWTHTVSQATRFTLYQLALDPANPLRYRYDDGWRDITTDTIEIQVRHDDGSLETRSHTFYSSHYGLILNLAAFSSILDGWPMVNGKILAMRDANLLTPLRSAQQWIAVGQSKDLDGFTDALRTIGNPVFHTLAADRFGDAFYGEVSAVPHVTQAQLEACTASLVGQVLARATSNAILALDGSTSACEWGEDGDSPPGSNLFGYASRPVLRTTDYVANGNNSYWIANAARPLTGFPLVMGWTQWENTPQSLRARMGHVLVEARKDTSDGQGAEPGFDLPALQGLMLANRVLGAEIAVDDVLAICDRAAAGGGGADQEVTAKAIAACDVLRGWDRHVDLASRGAQVWTEFWRGMEAERGDDFQGVVRDGELWKVDFDRDDPVHTPRGVDTTVEANHTLVLSLLAGAVDALTAAGVPLDAPWGEVQFYPRNDVNIPLHGGNNGLGTFGVIGVPLEPGGYFDVDYGNSYIQTVTWDDGDCPIADTILTHSQSTDPASPHYGDQTALYSRKEWIRFPYCEAEITAHQVGETLTLTQ
ncbi:MAG: penicillin acylase family protein [Deltaproteobacteria bacterium]|nr:penicillin acylase family protein [Deltaproteobacteria bacterium]